MSNSNLKSLWSPRELKIGHGNVLIHGNINLCQPEIDAFNKTAKFQQNGTFTKSQNGYLCPGKTVNMSCIYQWSLQVWGGARVRGLGGGANSSEREIWPTSQLKFDRLTENLGRLKSDWGRPS